MTANAAIAWLLEGDAVTSIAAGARLAVDVPDHDRERHHRIGQLPYGVPTSAGPIACIVANDADRIFMRQGVLSPVPTTRQPVIPSGPSIQV